MKINYCLEQVIRPVAPKIVGLAEKQPTGITPVI
jgi:hypothetical protein